MHCEYGDDTAKFNIEGAHEGHTKIEAEANNGASKEELEMKQQN
jgi:hypothetical protein